MAKLSIAAISYRGYNRLKWLFKSIKELSDECEHEIVLVEDSGNDKFNPKILELCEEYKVRLYRNEVNRGITYSWNRAVSEASSEYTCLINDDILLTKNSLKAMLYFLENNEGYGTVGYPTFFMKEAEMGKYFETHSLVPRHPGSKMLLAYEDYKDQIEQENSEPGACAVSVGCAFGFRKSVWEKIGKFDEGIRSLWEDFDFGLRLMQAGYQNYQLRTPIIYHCLSGTFSTNPELESNRIFRESEAYFIKKHGGRVNELTDPLFTANKKATVVKFLDKDGNPREEVCSL